MSIRREKIKILVLSHISDLLGGAERSMMDTFDYWTEHYSIEPVFILRLPLKSMAGELRKRGWKYYALDYTFWSDAVPPTKPIDIFQRSLQNNKAIQDIEKIIRDEQPDVVITNTILCPWAALAAYFQMKPHVWMVREYGDLDHGRIFEMDQARTLTDVGTLSDMVVANSKTLAAHYEQYIPKDKTTALYTPFKVAKLLKDAKAAVTSPFKHPGSLKLIITGNMSVSKGQLEAVQAVGELVHAGYDVELCVVGSYEGQQAYEAQVTATIKHYGIAGRVHFVGYHTNLMPYVELADVCIMASRKEAFGRVTFEYLVAGKAVVGANSGATPELVHNGDNGYVFEPGNVVSLTTALRHYVDDRALIARHGTVGKQLADQMMRGPFNADALFKKITEIVQHERQLTHQPINYFHRELEYPFIAKRVLDEAGAQSIYRLVRLRLRQRAKWAYYRLRSVKGRVLGR